MSTYLGYPVIARHMEASKQSNRPAILGFQEIRGCEIGVRGCTVGLCRRDQHAMAPSCRRQTAPCGGRPCFLWTFVSEVVHDSSRCLEQCLNIFMTRLHSNRHHHPTIAFSTLEAHWSASHKTRYLRLSFPGLELHTATATTTTLLLHPSCQNDQIEP